MTEVRPGPRTTPSPVVLALPFTGRWLVQNSPARRVPSHGTDLWGERYAIDFVGVDDRHRTASRRDWRTLVATEPPDRFFSFGRLVLAPAAGTVVHVHDGEVDHAARRSQAALVPYALGQAARVRQGSAAIAGNHLVVRLAHGNAHVALVHLRARSFQVAVGDDVTSGQPLAECGSSGNSTQPHLHLQVMDGPDPLAAHGVPMVFRDFREWPRGTRQVQVTTIGLPGERSVVEPLHGPVGASGP